jgi:hypothetical protein
MANMPTNVARRRTAQSLGAADVAQEGVNGSLRFNRRGDLRIGEDDNRGLNAQAHSYSRAAMASSGGTVHMDLSRFARVWVMSTNDGCKRGSTHAVTPVPCHLYGREIHERG